MIEGVEIKELRTHPDERGFFREVIRVTDGFFTEGFAQLSHSYMYPGVAKAWHVHKTQVDWWYVPVRAIPGPPKTFEYYTVLAEVEGEIEDGEDLNILLVPSD